MPGTFNNYNEASDYRVQISNAVTRELTSLILGVLERHALGGNLPKGDFDVLYFVKIVEEAMSDHGMIARVLQGESILWPNLDKD
jgi:hypothetical protein